MPITNPADLLAPIVTQLYTLAGNSTVSLQQRQTLTQQAHDLRGDLVTLVSAQFTQADGTYTSVMTNLTAVTAALNQAQKDITQVTNVINGVAQLATSLDSLIAAIIKTTTI